ncbi:M14 family zinc carboxypeptidase [Thalassotalea profundi]|uniref:Peptidase M14 n=1 Tax=Thalassotalea profundi TaxID=2036687 RepID=A0ABQ3J0Q7_9GAMM|nr:M14 family zinc carboxypeptidase [Thalassotalea profundi]GHE96857.1 peptidase M14 [Thalassotalea profundi]
MKLHFYPLFTLILAFLTAQVSAAKVEKYLPSEQNYMANILKPEEILGFGIGERHARHDQLVSYLSTLANQSERVKLTNIGLTTEYRKQILLTFSSPENLAKLPQLLNRKVGQQRQGDPLVVWLGYSVHGDEISGANAAMVVAYHLAASTNSEVQKMLEDTVIVMEPSLNPDGMDRFVSWVNTHRGIAPNSDPNHIEHHQDWRTGRTNHFGFDLNRDWLLLAQKESRNRLPFFHQYQPHVLGDFHEMGANSSYFFQPGIPSRTHPLTPKKGTELTQLIATFHASALDKENRLYYSQESFDDFYYGKGSTYPDIHGGVGILFEQASSRGFQQDSINGLLTFEYGIKNHVLTSLSTIKGAWENKQKFKDYRKTFYDNIPKLIKKADFNGYLISERFDKARLTTFLNKLKMHQIDVYPLKEDFRFEGNVYSKAYSYYVPLAQNQYHVIQALFNQGTNFKDNTFYDVSGWTMPLAMNIDFFQVDSTRGLSLSENTWDMPVKQTTAPLSESYSYVFEWHDFYAPKMLNALLEEGIKTKVATQAFSSEISGNTRSFSAGSIVIPAGIQQEEQWLSKVNKVISEYDIPVYSLGTGLTIKGIDIGSNSFSVVNPVKVLLVGGKPTSQYEAAELLYYLDNLLNIPVSVVEKNRLNSIDLSVYSHILMVDGNYKAFDSSVSKKLETWIKQGGVIFAQKRASQWLSEKEILKASFISKDKIDSLFVTDNLTYQDKEKLSAKKRIAGAIFESELDQSHPLTYGYADSSLPLFRNSTIIMEAAKSPFVTVAKYNKTPLLSGYTDPNLVNQISNSSAIIAHNLGKGRVIATSDLLMFRGYWFGSAKIIANSLFFAKAFSANAK